MAAQEDYVNMASYVASDSPENGTLALEMSDALVEIDRLRRWKDEACQVLDAWESVWNAAGRPGHPGQSKAASVRQWVEHRAD